MARGIFYYKNFEGGHILMAKNTRKVLREARKVLFDTVSEVEINYGIQISQNNSKIEALAADIVDTTKSKSYAEFLSELYYKSTMMKEAISAEIIAAIKTNNFFTNGYVLAINA